MDSRNLIGMPVSDIPTPALLIDADILAQNIDMMMRYLDGKTVRVRPHSKTFKSPMLGHQLIKAGAIGLCCATVGEAEIMVYAGLGSIFIANEVTGADKIRRTVNLCRYGEIIVAVDDESNLRQLSDAAIRYGTRLGVLVDLDVGMGRCGVRSTKDAVDLAKSATSLPGIEYRGMFGYEGHAVAIPDKTERTKVGQKANRYLVDTAEAVRKAGISVEIVSAAGTGTFDIAAEVPGITEIEAGSFVFMDTSYQKVGLPFQQALTVLATVVSRPEKDVVILDVGMKGISAERSCPVPKNNSGLEILKLSEAHAAGRILAPEGDLNPGDILELVPSHCCTTVSMYNEMHIVRSGYLEAVWPVAARGPY